VSNHVKRLRVFAGPNGSGKSTLYNYLVQIKAFHSYYHINPDVIARDLAVSLNLDNWPIDFSYDEVKRFLDSSPFQSMVNFNMSELITCMERRITIKDSSFSDISYLAAALANFLRMKMIRSYSSFSFESVLSHVSKILELEEAKKNNFKIYLYFITTSDPSINLQRVENRVGSGGHDVPGEKIINRYSRTMNNLYAAFKMADRAYLLDNSTQKMNGSFNFFAEKNGKRIDFSDRLSVPKWFVEHVYKHYIEDQTV
jgi:predicted ABC-type ATPase